jgi:photoactive yellow protein
MTFTFRQSDLLECLAAANSSELDSAPFGVVGMRLDGVVTVYNAFESRLAGLDPSTVVGRHFFSQVAPCTNNYLVAQRFESEAELDDVIDYVFTLRMEPKKVRLRLLKKSGHAHMFLAVEPR